MSGLAIDNSPLALETRAIAFRVGKLLIGIEISDIQEINQNVAITPTPIAPQVVRGVINLRGEVVTILDTRIILRMDPVDITSESANVVLRVEGEAIGLLVDRTEDVLTLSREDARPPSSIDDVNADLFKEVYPLEDRLLVVLDVPATISRY